MRWLKSISTDNQWDPDGVLYAILFTVLFDCFGSGWTMIHNKKDFDSQNFGMGIAAILGAGGAGYAAKRFAEGKDGSSSDTEVPKS